MIFVTVGTERFPFDRLMQAVDDALDAVGDEPIFVQTGTCTHIPSCPNRRLVPFDEFTRRIRDARIVVGHAGTGTFILCAQHGKIPIMMARKGRLGEHVDDHQQMLAERFARTGRILLINDGSELRRAIANYDQLCAALQPSAPDSPPLARHLGELLREIAHGTAGRTRHGT